MIALKDSEVWSRISRFGTPWPPFDFNSGMGVRNIGRRECVRLGLIQPEQRVSDPRQEFSLDDSVAANVADWDAELARRLQEVLEQGLQSEFQVNDDGILEAI
jgi:hypothetical protein